MSVSPPIRPRALALLVLPLLGLATGARAQLIPLKTIPVATGDQFLLFPAERLGMGGVSIALGDSLGDPFVNPATGARLAGTRLFAAPAFYRIGDDHGEGRTLPLGALFSGRSWFGSASLALQELEPSRTFGDCCARALADSWGPSPERLSDRRAVNLYAAGSLGRRLADGRTAVGASLAYAGLEAVEGVDLLYALSQRIRQDGHIADLRLGALRELPGDRALELVLLHHRVDMTHDVTYLDWRWDPETRRSEVVTREERELDRTDTWGAHLGYTRPLGAAGWRLGGAATLNFMTHPKIPNYEIMNIPRDPGHTWAYALGTGVAREAGGLALGADLVWEPIWSETWAAAEDTVRTTSGRVIQAGERTVENDFRFDNAHARLGVELRQGRTALQLGIRVRSISYELEQYDFVRERRRDQEESWMEWTPSWGLGLRFPEAQVRYAGRVTTGTGRPGVVWTGGAAERAALADAHFIPAPSGPLTLQEARVVTHRVTVVVPVR